MMDNFDTLSAHPSAPVFQPALDSPPPPRRQQQQIDPLLANEPQRLGTGSTRPPSTAIDHAASTIALHGSSLADNRARPALPTV
jgi:hypothetical protein